MYSFHLLSIMRLITGIIVISICVNHRKVTCERNVTVGSVYIDDITNLYINIEEKLWMLIGSSNQSDLVLNIHTEHLNFFRNSFSIERRRTESYRSDFEKIYGWEVQSLNSELDFVKNFELKDSLDEIIADDSTQMARTYVGYSTIMTSIYNRTVEENVFEKLKQVMYVTSVLGPYEVLGS